MSWALNLIVEHLLYHSLKQRPAFKKNYMRAPICDQTFVNIWIVWRNWCVWGLLVKNQSSFWFLNLVDTVLVIKREMDRCYPYTGVQPEILESSESGVYGGAYVSPNFHIPIHQTLCRISRVHHEDLHGCLYTHSAECIYKFQCSLYEHTKVFMSSKWCLDVGRHYSFYCN